MENKICLLHGSYFGQNFGDTLLIKLMANYVSSLVGSENVYFAIKGNEKEQSEIGHEVIPRKLKNKVNKIILCGGGYYGEPNVNFKLKSIWIGKNLIRHVLWIWRYKNADIGIFGIGFGPLSNLIQKRIIVNLFRKFKYKIYRDIESFNYANEYGANINGISDVCVDLALSTPFNIEKNNSVILHIHNLPINKVKLLLRDTIIFAADNSYSIVVLYDNPDQSSYINPELYKHLFEQYLFSNFIISKYINVDETIKLITSANLIITNKLHVGIVGIASGARVISIPTHQKTIRLYKQLGIEKYCIDEHSLNKEIFVTMLNDADNWKIDRKFIDEEINRLKNYVREFVLN